MSVVDNKVHLRKGDTGGKITIQIDKLHPSDVDYIRSIPGYENVALRELAARPSPQQTLKASKVDDNIVAQAAAIQISEPSANSFTYNGFNWKEWLMKAGVSPGDAIAYGQKFSSEKLDSSSVNSLDRGLLRDLGVSEGDIIRIKRAIVDSISVETSTINARELKAQNQNLDKIRKVFYVSFISQVSTLRSSNSAEDSIIHKTQQIENDEAFARKLQFEELQPQNKSKGIIFEK